MKQEIPVVIIGHQDHGKSTLIGRLLLDTKSIQDSRVRDIKETDKTSGQKFELAHLVDSFKQEREREMTMDTTRAYLKGKKWLYQLIDVPGHGELISQMLTGASSAEAALLIVSIEEGIKKQTRQHLEIAKLLGIEQLGVVINKMDVVNYKKEPFDKIVAELKKILININYKTKNIYFLPVSAWKGENVMEKSSKTFWYNGLTVTEFLENKFQDLKTVKDLPFRFLVQDIYVQNKQKILIGLVESGQIQADQEILFLPENIISKIKTIKTSEKKIKQARAGQNIGITCKNSIQINRGSVGCPLELPPKMGKTISGEIFWIEVPRRREVICECGIKQAKGRLISPKTIKGGQKTYYKIVLQQPIAFDPESKTILGKLIFKDHGKIIAVGNIKKQ